MRQNMTGASCPRTGRLLKSLIAFLVTDALGIYSVIAITSAITR